MVDSMHLMRISKHPIAISDNLDNLIIYDDLEHGALRIYEQIGGPVTVQQFAEQFTTIKNAAPIVEVVINSIWKEEEIFIHEISFNYGYENLVEPVINQILHFADFYSQYESVAISDREYERLIPYAKDVLAKFQKINRTYVFYLDKHEDE